MSSFDVTTAADPFAAAAKKVALEAVWKKAQIMVQFGFVVGIKTSLAPIGSCGIVVDFSHNFH